MRNEVLVGNIGTVLYTEDDKVARETLIEYRELSISGYGRCANEPVTWFRDSWLYQEHREIFESDLMT